MTSFRDKTVAIAISSRDDFFDIMPPYFERHGDTLVHDVDKATTFSLDDDFFSKGYTKVLQTETLGDFETLKKTLLNRPIFMSICAGVLRANPDGKQARSGRFLLYINTRHPQCSHLLRPKFEDAEKTFRNGKNFSLEIDFSPPVVKWYRTANPGYAVSDYYVDGACFHITNSNIPTKWSSPCSKIFVEPVYSIFRSLRAVDFRACAHITLVKMNNTQPENNNEPIASQPAYNPEFTAPPPYELPLPGVAL